MKRVLIANRGEIAVRVMRTCKELGLETVAVFSDVDRAALHVRMADRAVGIGPAPARESYLVVDKIIDACVSSGADALHPGYGFLSENVELVAACEAKNITFIGPPTSAMEQMGDKTTARQAMESAGVPVVPGDNGPGGRGFPTAELALEAAKKVGFPVMLKASAGGGGKGMRLCEDDSKFTAAYDGAQREAKGAFGDDTVYLEKAIIQPRHVEVQIFADNHGNVVHLGERDCSIQRRHQKVVEESPSTAVSDDLRARMGDIAVKAARACDYRGAGTVEFLLAQDGSFYFLEMNTRLQVEHPVTEMCYGVDLVAWQITVAQGQPLSLTQDEITARRRGVAIECRVYAEDPIRFFPAPGTITTLRVPGGPYVRDDSGVSAGSEISVHYDPLISKLIVWGEDRPQAIARMRRALDEYHVGGTVKTNLPFHRKLLRHDEFVAGKVDTGFIDREKKTLLVPGELDEGRLQVMLATAVLHVENEGKNGVTHTGTGSPSSSPSAWRMVTRSNNR